MSSNSASSDSVGGYGTIPGVVARAITEFGDREAIVDGDIRWTFAELGSEIYRCAGAMMAAGVQRGDRVAIWAPNSHRFVVGALGAVVAGAVLVPVNTRYKGEEAAWILGKSRARLLLVENGFLGNDYVGMLASAGMPATLESVVALDSAFSVFLDRAVPADAVLERAGSIGAGDLADMFFTSGTTGRPKGVLAGHGQNIRVYQAWSDRVGLRAGDRYLLVNPLFHTFGYKAGLLACLLRGATLLPLPVFDAGQVLALVDAEKITVLPGPPTLYASMLDHPGFGNADVSSLRLAVTGAAVVPVRLVERMRERLFSEVVIAYGLTETCGTATAGSPLLDPETMARTVGTAIEGTEVIVASADGTPLPAGKPGEVLVRGYNVMRGYFEDPASTAAAIDADGWLHTGDVGVLDTEGNLRITDRLKDMFTVGGFNAYPAEIEQVIARHEAVSEAAVIGMPDERLGEVALGYVVLRPGFEVTENEIIAFCRERLANFKVPRAVRFVPSLPRNASGKVLKFELRSGLSRS